jgi:hypothetical protein
MPFYVDNTVHFSDGKKNFEKVHMSPNGRKLLNVNKTHINPENGYSQQSTYTF